MVETQMQNELTESVQQSIRPGEMCDTFYYGETNLEKQAYPCVVDNRFFQQFTNLSSGQSQFIISPKQGVSDIVLAFTMGAVTGTATGACLPAAWGYNLINRVSVRYGSSAQYYFSGAEMYLLNLLDSENGDKRDSLSALGGVAVNGANCSGAKAYCYLKLPHNSPRANGKPLPFPSDLLVQPIVITVELYPVQQIFRLATGSTAVVPTALASAYLQVRQETLSDSSDLLSRRVDMNKEAYTFPLMYFPQQEVQVALQPATIAQNVNLTGFRAGEVKSILLWLTNNATTTLANPVAGAATSWQPQIWAQMSNVILTYNGEIFFQSNDSAAQLWNLVSDEKGSQVNTFLTNNDASTTATTSTWIEVPFAQINVAWDREMKLVHGKPILNSVVNLSFNCPDNSASYTLHAVYLYNASLLCSRGSAEYIF